MNRNVGRRARRLSMMLCALTLVPAGQAAADATWANEAAMINSTFAREDFVLDPGRGSSWTRDQLLGNETYRLYFRSRNMENILMWAPEGTITPSPATRWAGCGLSSLPGAAISGACPAGRESPAHTSPIGNALTDTTIRALHHDGAFIALACANFSERTVAGPTPTITGVKYEDVDGDGVRDTGEPLLAGWEMQLYQGGAYAGTTTTDASGRYRFTLDAGDLPNASEDFEVREVQQAGWVASQTPGAVHIQHGSGSVTVNGIDFGNYRPATIRGIKYEDLDADGDGTADADDPRLPGWTIDVSGPTSPAPAVTDAAGVYAVSGLRPGTYAVSERLQPGWRYSAPADGRHSVTVRSGETLTADFGNYRPATIQGAKFDDHDVDRARAASEPGLSGWRIDLTGGRSPAATAVTGADGGYRFDGLVPGTYVVAETLRAGWRQSAPASGTHTVTVRSGEVRGGDFGNVCLGTTRVSITEESTGAPLSGVEVRVEEIAVTGVLANDPPLPRTTTGTPTFADLLPGTYRVVVFLPPRAYTTDPRLTVVDGRLAVVKRVTVNECAVTDVPVKLFTRSTGKVTGGMKMPVPGGFATAGFVFMTRQGQPEGSLQYQDHATGLNLHSERIEQIHVAANHAWIGGVVKIDGREYRFELHLVDNGEPGRNDRFELIVENGYREGFDQTIEGGNDQIHPPEKT